MIDEESLDAARAMGMPEEEIEQRRREQLAAQKEDVFEVWPENWRPLLLAMGMATQIRTSMNGAVGFDYTALPVVEARIGLSLVMDLDEQADSFSAFRKIEQILFQR
jgi:hypothetical protein